MSLSADKKNSVLGIDLGTTNSAAAIFQHPAPITIPSAEGQSEEGKMFPSVVAFAPDGTLLVGQLAKRQLALNPKGTIFEIKRKMGTDYKIEIQGKTYTPEQISGFILQKIKNDANLFLGSQINEAVITVPAYFNDNQRQATSDAGEIAGLTVLRIINEPTAACLAYGLDRIKSDDVLKAMVFSFGGGTHDVTIMDIKGDTFRVLATSGDTQTGGTDIDNAIVERLSAHFEEKTGVNIRSDQAAYVRLKEAAEEAKIKLSSHIATNIDLPFLVDIAGPKHLKYTLTQSELEKLALPIVSRVESTIKTVLYDSRIGPDEIDRLILIGGQTRMPLLRHVVEHFMGRVAEVGVDPMECVALGAAIQGAISTGQLDYHLLDVTPLSLGVENAGEMMTRIIERNTPIPTSRTQIFTTAKDDQIEVTVHILQGERAMASDNISIGIFDLEGIPPRRRGIPQIEVTFEVDANGILHVSAKEKISGVKQTVTITGRTRLAEEEKRRMVEDAELFAGIDHARKEKAKILKTANLVLYRAERLKKEPILPSEAKVEIDKVILELDLVLRDIDSSGSFDDVRTKIIELTDLLEQTTELYQIVEGL